MERVKFAGIMGMIFDEFAMKRLGGLRRLIQKKKQRLSPDGLKPIEELQLCRKELTRQRGVLATLVQHELRPALMAEGISILDHNDFRESQKKSWISIFSVLSSPFSHPFLWTSVIHFLSSVPCL